MLSKRIAIVDDDLDLLNLFKEALQMNGYKNVHTFAEPIEALNYIQKKAKEFDLVISDFKMPSMNGCELCMKLRKFNPDLNFIIITAYDYMPSNTSSFKLMKKPIPIPQFLEIVNENIIEQQVKQPKTKKTKN